MNSQFRTLQIIHLALCAGVFLFAVVAIILHQDKMIFEVNFQNTAPYNPIFPIIALIFAFSSLVIFRKMVEKIDRSANLESKMAQYQSAFIVSAAMLEGGALINIVAFLITGNAFFLIFSGICLFLLIRSRPTKEKLISSLQLQYPESDRL